MINVERVAMLGVVLGMTALLMFGGGSRSRYSNIKKEGIKTHATETSYPLTESPGAQVEAPEGGDTEPSNPSSAPEKRGEDIAGITQGKISKAGPSPPPPPSGNLADLSALPQWAETYILDGREINESSGQQRSARCSDNAKCQIRDRCVATPSGICYDAPSEILTRYEFRPRPLEGRSIPSGGKPDEELACSWQPDPSPLPEIHKGALERPTKTPSSVEEKIAEVQRQLKVFKHMTGSHFQKWYDWDAKIRPVTERRGFKMTAQHEGFNQIYRIHNFCIRPSGRLSGFQPDVKPFVGGSDVAHVIRSRDLRKFNNLVKPYFNGEVESLSEEPEFYIDQKIAFLPLVDHNRDSHVAHTLMKTGGLAMNIEDAFGRSEDSSTDGKKKDAGRRAFDVMAARGYGKKPKKQFREEGNFLSSIPSTSTSPREEQPGEEGSKDVPMAGPRSDVTVAYVLRSHEGDTCGRQCTFKDFAFPLYTTLAAKSHMMLYMKPSYWTKPWRYRTASGANLSTTLSPEEHLELARLMQTPLCFKEGVAYQACHVQDCVSKDPHSRNAWPLYGWRQPQLQQRIADRFRGCAAVDYLKPESGAARKKSLHVLISYRTRSRFVLGMRSLLPNIVAHFQNLAPGKTKIFAIEMSGQSVLELVGLYSTMDMVIAPRGSGFMYGFVTPPGTVGISLTYTGIHGSTRSGIDVNEYTDYGSMWKASGGYHLVVQLQETSGRTPHTAMALPFPLMERAVKSAVCLNSLGPRLIRYDQAGGTLKAVEEGLKRKEACEMCSDAQVFQAEKDDVVDEGRCGLQLKREIRSSLPESLVAHAPRLVALFNLNSSSLSQFNPLRAALLDVMRHKPRAKTVLLLAQCPTADQDDDGRFAKVLDLELWVLRQYLPLFTSIVVTMFGPRMNTCNPQSLKYVIRKYNNRPKDWTSHGRVFSGGVWSPQELVTRDHDLLLVEKRSVTQSVALRKWLEPVSPEKLILL